MVRVGIDVGGTFTDLMLVDDEHETISVHKVPSTPADPSVATISGLRELCDADSRPLEQIEQLLHGTTVATNIVLERKGSKTGMITTEGFRDVIYVGRHRRPKTFSIYQDLPWRDPSLVDRRLRMPVSERIVPPGEVQTELDEQQVRDAIKRLREEDVEAVAVCFLFSFLNPAHELRVKQILAEEMPDAHLSISHEVTPQHREYERFSTTALNAYIGPKTSRYLASMSGALQQLSPRTEFHLMASNGGTLTVDGAVQRPTQLLMSGPVAGIIGGIAVGRAAGLDSVITLDVGGTSADIGVAPGGQLRMKHLYDTNIGGYDVMVPMVDLDTIGAGGGSIARIDAGGLLRVGPHSAGAVPGPVCYGQGGTEPTATDAQVVLGRLRRQARLAGNLELTVEPAREALARLGERLSMDPDETALGVTQIITQNMVNAISINSVQKGFDPRDFSLVAFGGGGPLYGVDIARELSIPRVIVPPAPGDHVGNGAAGLGPEVRDAADRDGDLGAGRRERARADLPRDGGPGAGKPAGRWRAGRATGSSSGWPTADTSGRPTSCWCRSAPVRSTHRRSRPNSKPLTSVNSSIGSTTRRCRSFTCAATRSA